MLRVSIEQRGEVYSEFLRRVGRDILKVLIEQRWKNT